jgi:hypothetical protein
MSFIFGFILGVLCTLIYQKKDSILQKLKEKFSKE